MNDSFCSLPWVNLTTNTQGEIIPCCISTAIIKKQDGTPYNLGADSITEIYNSSDYVTIREKMLRGEKVDGCEECYKHEENGGRSNRNLNNDHWRIESPTTIVEPDIKYFDIRFGNLCNLACRSCHPGSSSQFAKETNTLQDKGMNHFHAMFSVDTNTWYNTDTFLNNLESQINHIQHVYLAGGEPSVNKKVFNMLEMLIDAGRSKEISVSISTNMTNTNYKFYELLQEFKQIILFASIDGYGAMQEYLRYPSKWSIIESNMERLVELSNNILIYVTPVIQIGNLNNITDLFEYVESFNRKYNRTVVDMLPIDLESPDHLNSKFLPHAYKIKCWNRIDEWFKTKNQFISSVAMDRMSAIKTKCDSKLSADLIHNNLTSYIQYNNIFDLSRNVKLEDSNIELAEILNDPSLWS